MSHVPPVEAKTTIKLESLAVHTKVAFATPLPVMVAVFLYSKFCFQTSAFMTVRIASTVLAMTSDVQLLRLEN